MEIVDHSVFYYHFAFKPLFLFSEETDPLLRMITIDIRASLFVKIQPNTTLFYWGISKDLEWIVSCRYAD